MNAATLLGSTGPTVSLASPGHTARDNDSRHFVKKGANRGRIGTCLSPCQATFSERTFSTLPATRIAIVSGSCSKSKSQFSRVASARIARFVSSVIMG